MEELKIGEKYINKNGATNPTPMTLLEITETDYVFIDGASPWGGKKEDIKRQIKKGLLIRFDGDSDE